MYGCKGTGVCEHECVRVCVCGYVKLEISQPKVKDMSAGTAGTGSQTKHLLTTVLESVLNSEPWSVCE